MDDGYINNGLMNTGSMDGWMDGWMIDKGWVNDDEWMDRWMDGG